MYVVRIFIMFFGTILNLISIRVQVDEATHEKLQRKHN